MLIVTDILPNSSCIDSIYSRIFSFISHQYPKTDIVFYYPSIPFVCNFKDLKRHDPFMYHEWNHCNLVQLNATSQIWFVPSWENMIPWIMESPHKKVFFVLEDLLSSSSKIPFSTSMASCAKP